MTVSSLAQDDFAWLAAAEQLAALDAKEVSSVELVELVSVANQRAQPSAQCDCDDRSGFCASCGKRGGCRTLTWK